MPDSSNFYTILGVPSSASAEEIRAAFKQLAMQFHPDRNPGNSLAEEQFKKIVQAYEVLSDPERRRTYDLRISGYLDFIHLHTAKEQTEQYRKKYGTSRRRPLTKEQADALLLSEFDKAMKRFPLRWRYLVSLVMMLVGGQWAIYNIEKVDTGIFVFYMLLGYLSFLLGSYMLYKTVYVYLRARFLRKEIKSFYDNSLIAGFIILLLAGWLTTVGISDLRVKYHLNHYKAYTTGELTEVHNGYIVYTYITGDREIEKKEKIDLSDISYYAPGRYLIITYSYKDPFVARVYRGNATPGK